MIWHIRLVEIDEGQAPAQHPRPGGRSARVRAAVLRATLDTLITHGYAAVTVTGVADAAGVHSTTVYRRWGGRAALVVDAVQLLSESTVATPDTGDLTGDLTAVLGDVVQLLTRPQGVAVVRSLAAIPPELDEEITAAKVRFWQGRFDAGAAVVERAITRGELAEGTDPQQVFELLVGPAYLRALLTGFPLDEEFIHDTVGRVVDAFHTKESAENM